MTKKIFISGASRPKNVKPTEVKKLGVLGSGLMGHGITYVSALSGLNLIMTDATQENADKGLSRIKVILNEELKMPFTIFDFKKKITSAIAKNEFKKNSLINLKGYIIDKNERKIKKNNLELQLSEKEVDFLIVFSENKNPIKRNLVLKKVWNYSQETETHTVETHIHRLRKKIFSKFGDSDFIKNNKKGYYI